MLTCLLLCTRRVRGFGPRVTVVASVTGYPDSIKESIALGRGSRSIRQSCGARLELELRVVWRRTIHRITLGRSRSNIMGYDL